jgi:hypothetical protein
MIGKTYRPYQWVGYTNSAALIQAGVKRIMVWREFNRLIKQPAVKLRN